MILLFLEKNYMDNLYKKIIFLTQLQKGYGVLESELEKTYRISPLKL